MSSIIEGFEYDIFVSYRQNDNRPSTGSGTGWVTDFVKHLNAELSATIKEPVSVYFDANPHDGLLESHNVDRSLERKLKCLIFIPILSQTYCASKSFAWQHEFLPFVDQSKTDTFGLNVELPNGNVAGRVLPIRIHELEEQDTRLVQEKLGSQLRPIDFIYQSPGVNRPLMMEDTGSLSYRNQINKVANAVKAILSGLSTTPAEKGAAAGERAVVRGFSMENIQERNLPKVALAYIIVGLVVWKTMDLAGQRLFIEGLSRITAIVLAILFPLAMLLAWRFEKGPDGFIRSSSPEARTNPFTREKKRPLTSNLSILILLVITLALYFIPQNPGTGAGAGAINGKSIAVLYFDNMSGDPDQEYLSDGMTEEIITRLAKIEGLSVISRTSVRTYKGQALNLKKIARELGVPVVLEGSIRKSGNQLKVTAQLIDAETDEHLWAESFDRELKDVFLVQAEIAEAIAAKFSIKLSPEVSLKVQHISTKSTDAYEYYLKGRHIAFSEYYYKFDSLAFRRSLAMYEKAIELDPQFALAFAGLADLYDMVRQSRRRHYDGNVDSLRHALSWKAYQLDPNSAFVNNVRIWMLINRPDQYFDSALFHARRAIELEPSDFYNQQTMGTVLSRNAGLPDLALPFYEKAVALNPLDAQTHAEMAACYQAVGNVEGRNRHYQAAYELSPDDQFLSARDVMHWLIDAGRAAEAERMLRVRMSKYKNVRLRDVQFHLWLAAGDKRRIDSVEKSLGPFEKSMLYAYQGRTKECIQIMKGFQSSSNPKDRDLSTWYLWLRNEPWSRLKGEPEFEAFLEKEKVAYEACLKKYKPYTVGLNN